MNVCASDILSMVRMLLSVRAKVTGILLPVPGALNQSLLCLCSDQTSEWGHMQWRRSGGRARRGWLRPWGWQLPLLPSPITRNNGTKLHEYLFEPSKAKIFQGSVPDPWGSLQCSPDFLAWFPLGHHEQWLLTTVDDDVLQFAVAQVRLHVAMVAYWYTAICAGVTFTAVTATK